ncbi:AMP-binding protein [Nonomuraea sediminis]|uniref:AMP-binding protein n=1 Tax=Nonomuraea sediminis TaxID=2835864 RepID=UPI001BDCB9F2|nr:AMP-binding protein [Nonomuraea sediminis]
MLRLLAGEAARRFGARAAVVTGTTCLSFAALDRLSDEVAAGLAHRGIRIGDVVALALPDGPEFVVCYVAAAKLGAITAGIGTRRPGLSRAHRAAQGGRVRQPAARGDQGARRPAAMGRGPGAPVCNLYVCTEAGLGTRPEDPPEDTGDTGYVDSLGRLRLA